MPTTVTTTRTLGPLTVPAIGLGCMGMSDFYGPADEAESNDTLHAALEAGITLLDTGDFYGMGHNEMLIGNSLKGQARDRVLLSVKFGALRDPNMGFFGYDVRPKAVKNYCTYSLRRLKVDYIDIYRPSRLDPEVPIEDTVGAIKELIDQGYVRYLGLSEMGAHTVRRAHAVHPVVDLQIEYSLLSRGIEGTILPTLRELGIGVTAYGVLSRGLIAQPGQQYGAGDFRAILPRFQGDNLAHNQALVAALHDLAATKGCTPAQLAIAWVLSRGTDIVPLVGARRRDRLAEALGALSIQLTTAELQQLEATFPTGAAHGDRYPTPLMSALDSEK